MSSSLVPSSSPLNYWVVIPAAGVGSRMQADRPKQYLPLHGTTVLEQTLTRLDKLKAISGFMLAISSEDRYWAGLNPELSHPLYTTEGGQERCHSVLNALIKLGEHGQDEDWVLVHDAARPCVRQEDIMKMINELQTSEVGGILAIPLHDTIKQASDSGTIVSTEDRTRLWRAQTPQMFRLGMLRHALEQSIEDEVLVTDEASALEYVDKAPKLIEGHGDNIKITQAGDLALAEFYLQQQDRETCA